MELGKNNFRYYGHSHKEKKILNRKTLIFSGFIFVIGAIIFTTLYSNGSITGNVIFPINPSSINPNNSIIMSSELTVPDLNMKGDYSEIKILSKAKTTIYLGDKSFQLGGLKENKIILKEFSGKIELDENGILLNGKAFEINLNDLPIKERSDKEIRISSDSKIPYNLIEFKEDLFLKEIDYVSSGILFIGEKNQDKMILNKDSLLISNYFGKLKINRNILFLEGYAENIKILGDMKEISISN